MINKRTFLLELIAIVLILSSCSSEKNVENVSDKTTNQVTQSSIINNNNDSVINKTANEPIKSNEVNYEIAKETYTDKNITINYPQITNLNDTSKQKKINEIIKNDILKSFYKGPEDGMAVEIKYIIKLSNISFLSIQYIGIISFNGANHPTNEIYTTNIDLAKDRKLRFTDVVNVDENVVNKFKNGKYIYWEDNSISQSSEDLKSDVISQVNDYTTDDSIKWFNKSDDTDENDSHITFSYFTKDSIGISLAVPHAIGDHAEFEVKYSDLAPNIKHEFSNLPNIKN